MLVDPGRARARSQRCADSGTRSPNASMDPIARRVVVRGLVQGVAFRHFTKVRARELGLGGWVQNQDEGSVEVWAEGPRDKVEALVAWLRRGPPAAAVTRVEIEEREPGGHERFEVRRP